MLVKMAGRAGHRAQFQRAGAPFLACLFVSWAFTDSQLPTCAWAYASASVLGLPCSAMLLSAGCAGIKPHLTWHRPDPAAVRVALGKAAPAKQVSRGGAVSEQV